MAIAAGASAVVAGIFGGSGNHVIQITIVIVVGSIANTETVEVDVAPGHRTLRLESGRHRSAERSFDVEQNEVVGFSCHGPRFWPMLVAAIINPDLWISLRRE